MREGTMLSRALRLGTVLAVGLVVPAVAASQSSNTSTNCSNGICTRTETVVIEDRHGRRGWSRTDLWDERGHGHRAGPPHRHRRGVPPPQILWWGW